MDEPITIAPRRSPVTLAEAAAQPAASAPMPPITPPPPVTPGIAPPPTGKTPKPAASSGKTVMIVAGLLAVGILISGFLYLRSTTPPKEEAVVPATPTIVPTPTQQPNLSRISTTSAFMRYSEEVASFSAVLNAFSLQDSTLVPPILDIELDLKN